MARLVDVPPNIAARREEHALLLDALIASIALGSVRSVIDPNVPFTIEEWIEAGAIAPDFEALFGHLLRLLVRFGAASEAERVWRVAGSNDLPDIAEIWRLLLAEAPELVAELALAAAAAEEMPRLLADGLRPAETSPLPMVEHLLHGSPVGAAGIDLVCAAIGEIAKQWPQDRPLRVLELGADGGATRRLLDRLAQSGVALAYRATNPDQEQAARLGFIVSAFAGASASCWSPRDPADDLDDSRFDIILSVHAGARLRLDTAALAQLCDLLAPGGLFIAVEPAPNPLWDVVFGRYAGWWQGRDDIAESSPLRSSEEWRCEARHNRVCRSRHGSARHRTVAEFGFVGPGAAGNRGSGSATRSALFDQPDCCRRQRHGFPRAIGAGRSPSERDRCRRVCSGRR